MASVREAAIEVLKEASEPLHRTLLDEHIRIAGGKNWYETVEPIQKDLDAS